VGENIFEINLKCPARLKCNNVINALVAGAAAAAMMSTVRLVPPCQTCGMAGIIDSLVKFVVIIHKKMLFSI
jgi:hypothetical protein